MLNFGAVCCQRREVHTGFFCIEKLYLFCRANRVLLSMSILQDVLPQRRVTRLSNTFSWTRCQSPLRNTGAMIHVQESSKGDPNWRSIATHATSWIFTKNLLFLIGFVAVLLTGLFHGSGVLLQSANALGRQCFDVKPRHEYPRGNYKFAMVTCTDSAETIPGRSFKGLMPVVIPNKVNYAKRHGYKFIDASELVSTERPPSWSKILAVRRHLPDFDWVFWNDADSIVMNPAISLEDVIEAVIGNLERDEIPDLIVTKDVTGVNAGMFFLRNSLWSIQFLELWWNQSSFVRPFGQVKSGDNDALKYLIENMPKQELGRHVRIPKMQCLFNSYLWKPSLQNGNRLMALTKSVWRGVYSKGDFMLHLAGLNDKKTHMKKILQALGSELAECSNCHQRV